MESKWNKMLVLSLFLHLVVFSLILFVPESMPTRRIRGTIYEVNLVELPSKKPLKGEESAKVKTDKISPIPKKTTSAKRISVPEAKEEPVVIAKRTVTTQKKKTEKPKVSSAKLLEKAVAKVEKKVKANQDTVQRIDQALSKIEKKVKTEEENDHLGEAISRLETKNQGGSAKGFADGSPVSGMAIDIYRSEVEDWIKSHWVYPVTNKDNLEVVVLVTAKSNGTIIQSSFTKKSSNAMFNQSVLKAIEQSDPLPPFPLGYRMTQEEFEITFNLNELEQN